MKKQGAQFEKPDSTTLNPKTDRVLMAAKSPHCEQVYQASTVIAGVD
jgi:hypothetical protein